MVESGSREIILKDLEFCCDYSLLNLENVSILSSKEDKKVDERIRHTEFDTVGEDVTHNEYNCPYYTYMKKVVEYMIVYISIIIKKVNIGELNL